jgi:hypothetical protein
VAAGPIDSDRPEAPAASWRLTFSVTVSLGLATALLMAGMFGALAALSSALGTAGGSFVVWMSCRAWDRLRAARTQGSLRLRWILSPLLYAGALVALLALKAHYGFLHAGALATGLGVGVLAAQIARWMSDVHHGAGPRG